MKYFVLKEDGGRVEYYRVYPNDQYEWWDTITHKWIIGSYKSWSMEYQKDLYPTSPLEMVIPEIVEAYGRAQQRGLL